MKKNIFDSHAHYDSEAFDADRKELLNALPERGVCGIINCASDMASSLTSLELADEFKFIYAACGVHPHEAEGCKDGYISVLEKLCTEKKCVAVGEIGLDYHYDFSPRDIQKTVFEQQLILAKELDLPVIIHDREAHEDTMNLLKKYTPKGVVHCFSGSAEMAKEVVKLGMYIGLGGAATFKNARKPREVAEVVPSDKLLIETDCPYMTPVPLRGQRCDSSFIPYTAEVIAQVRGITVDEILDLTRKNANTLFGLEL
ncbi:MAG: TatD family hydrolase [Acutalibacteraceae bacterium]|nr:TatD family hydrolase [Acutalibacteraceae bacterium]